MKMQAPFYNLSLTDEMLSSYKQMLPDDINLYAFALASFTSLSIYFYIS